jgi:hypothetical protein
MGVIKGVLKEELENSREMLKSYQREIANVKGCLIRKKIGKRYYYYLAKRQGAKVRFIYKGPISAEVRDTYAKQRKLLRKYKKLLAQVKSQIRFIRRALRGKEAV